ncbi:hypothetical protein ACWCPI_38715 [Streptomyces sp. NPDC001920]
MSGVLAEPHDLLDQVGPDLAQVLGVGFPALGLQLADRHPDPFGVTVVPMEEDAYRVRLTEAFER